MKIRDLIRTSQVNLVRSKLRTALTILAVFIGTFTISITSGVGNGVKAYIDKELGNVGVRNAFVVVPKTSSNPLSSDVVEYNPEAKSGFLRNVLLTPKDMAQIADIKNVQKVIPDYGDSLKVDYITTGGKKYQANASQYIAGLNLDMASGRVIDVNNPDEVSIPIRYVSPLGFSSAQDALGKNLTLGYKDINGKTFEKKLTIVGIQQESILGNAAIYIAVPLASDIVQAQSAGIAGLSGGYGSLLVEFDQNLPQAQVDQLKQVLLANNYNAQTIQDRIGTFSKIINGITVGLDIFGIIALLVAGFGIVNTLLMAVNERTPEIGLMKALGANSRTVFGIFSLEAASIGFWGALLGIGASIGVGRILNKYAASHFLKDFVGFNLLAFPIIPTLAIFLGIILLAFIAGALPSIKASRLDPIKALRYE